MSTGIGDVSSLEQVLDRGTERYSLSLRKRSQYKHTESGVSRTTALALPARDAALSTVHASPLTWRGLEVSDELQRYAARVARGEQLAPYRGQVLARPSVDFPWGAAGVLAPQQQEQQRARRSSLTAGWLLSAGALVVGVLGLGGVAAGVAGSDVVSESTFTPSAPTSGASAEALPAEQPSVPATLSFAVDSPVTEATSSARESRPAKPRRVQPRRAQAVAPAARVVVPEAQVSSPGSLSRQVAAAEQRPSASAASEGSGPPPLSALLLEAAPF